MLKYLIYKLLYKEALRDHGKNELVTRWCRLKMYQHNPTSIRAVKRKITEYTKADGTKSYSAEVLIQEGAYLRVVPKKKWYSLNRTYGNRGNKIFYLTKKYSPLTEKNLSDQEIGNTFDKVIKDKIVEIKHEKVTSKSIKKY